MFTRPATSDDAERLARVHVEAWKAAYRGQVPDRYLDELSVEGRLDVWDKLLAATSSEAAIVVLVDSDQAVGFAYCKTRIDDDRREPTGEIASMYLDPRVWRRGGGRLLMTAAVEWFHAMDFRQATLWVLETNSGPRRFYEATGWHPDGARQEIELGGRRLVEVRYRLAL